MSTVRIIGGQFKGRRLAVLNQKGLRPTPDRVRETLFNWLQFKLAGKRCLDLFAGTGALGFEALSRGAQCVSFVEKDPKIAAALTKNCDRLHLRDDMVEVIGQAAHSFLKRSFEKPYDIIFLDPPFGSDLLEISLFSVSHKSDLTQSGSLLYIECEKDKQFDLPDCWQILKESFAGQVAYRLYHYSARMA